MDIVEQLQKLQALREQGVLTEDEFVKAKQRVIDGEASVPPPIPPIPSQSASSAPLTERATAGLNGLHRSWHDRWIAGVCGGLAVQTNIPTWAWRILFILTTFLHGIGLLMYILMWIFVPLERPKLLAVAAPPSASSDRVEPK